MRALSPSLKAAIVATFSIPIDELNAVINGHTETADDEGVDELAAHINCANAKAELDRAQARLHNAEASGIEARLSKPPAPTFAELFVQIFPHVIELQKAMVTQRPTAVPSPENPLDLGPPPFLRQPPPFLPHGWGRIGRPEAPGFFSRLRIAAAVILGASLSG